MLRKLRPQMKKVSMKKALALLFCLMTSAISAVAHLSLLYCLALAYCGTWVPWSVGSVYGRSRGLGYGWLWVGPNSSDQYASLCAVDVGAVILRLVALTALFGAALLFVELFPRRS